MLKTLSKPGVEGNFLNLIKDSILNSEILGEGNGNPLQCSWLENPRDGVA